MALLHTHFFSEVLGLAVTMDVILPERAAGQIGMDGADARTEHPTLYLLHGLSDDHTIWQRRTSIERYVAPLGLAVVMPTVHRSFYTDQVSGYKYWTFISEEVPRVAESFFHLSPRREDRFAAGLSMGGYGAMKLGLACPDRFAAVASLSGALNIARLSEQLGDIPEDRNNEFVNTFGPLEALPGSDNDLLHLAQKVQNCPQLYVACGTEDFLYEDNLTFKAHAEKLGLPLTYAEEPGTHEWGYWDKTIQDVLAWLPIQKR